MHEGSEIAPNELIEFDNNLVRAKQFSGERNDEKDVIASLALMEEMIANQCMVKREITKCETNCGRSGSENEWIE